jgi:nucleoid DNA-binding protein
MAETQTINPQTDTLTLADTIESIVSGLTKGQKVTIEGLGTFHAVAKDERPGRNPRTGEATTFRASRKPKLEFDKDFVEKIDIPKATTATTTAATTAVPTAVPTPSPAATPAPVPASASVSAPAAPVLPPPIPAELIAAAAAGSESKWQIKAPNGGFVEISTSQFADWGVGELTPVYSVATGWRLAGQVPELLGFIVK